MAQNKNGPIIGLAIFSVLAIVFAVFWYITYSDNQLLQQSLAAATKKEQDLNGTVQALIQERTQLKQVIGAEEAQAVGDKSDTSSIVGQTDALLNRLGGDGTVAPGDLLKAINSTASESSKHMMAADNRRLLADSQAAGYQQALAAKDAEIVKFKTAADTAEAQRLAQETKHSEELSKLVSLNEDLSREKEVVQAELADLRDTSARRIEELNTEISKQRTGLVGLRNRVRATVDPTFSRPDGFITSVDHNAELCYLNFGAAEGLRTGVTFSVYGQNNSGVGRANTDDIKGKIEVVEITGPRSSKARIVTQDFDNPIGQRDPVYSPIFQAGQTLEIVLAGQVRINGLNRDELHRIIRAAGAKIAVEVDDTANFTDGDGNPLSDEQAKEKITARTRYFVIGDLGDPSELDGDPALAQLYKDIRTKKVTLEKEAENLGIFPIGLSTFLEHIGWNPKQRAWTPENGQPFPSRLSAGSRSTRANSSFGNRASSAVISGQFSGRNQSSLSSGGTTSDAYQDN